MLLPPSKETTWGQDFLATRRCYTLSVTRQSHFLYATLTNRNEAPPSFGLTIIDPAGPDHVALSP